MRREGDRPAPARYREPIVIGDDGALERLCGVPWIAMLILWSAFLGGPVYLAFTMLEP